MRIHYCEVKGWGHQNVWPGHLMWKQRRDMPGLQFTNIQYPDEQIFAPLRLRRRQMSRRYREADVDPLSSHSGVVDRRGILFALFHYNVLVYRPPGRLTFILDMLHSSTSASDTAYIHFYFTAILNDAH